MRQAVALSVKDLDCVDNAKNLYHLTGALFQLGACFDHPTEPETQQLLKPNVLRGGYSYTATWR